MNHAQLSSEYLIFKQKGIKTERGFRTSEDSWS